MPLNERLKSSLLNTKSHKIRSLNSTILIGELVFSLPVVLLNVYFASRFVKLSVLSANLRLIFAVSNLSCALCTALRVAMRWLPEEWYSIENGCYGVAALYYGSHFFLRVTTFMINFKYNLIIAERWYAFRHCNDYEDRDACWATKAMLTLVALLLIAVGCRVRYAFMKHINANESVDEALMNAFITERSPEDFAILFTSLFVALSVGFACFGWMKFKVPLLRNYAKTLSESYQIRQTLHVVDALWPTFLILFLCAVPALGLFILASLDFYFWSKSHESFIFVASMNGVWVFLSVYLFSSTLWTMWSLRAFRRIVVKDFERLLGIRVPRQSFYISCTEELKRRETSDHFRRLQEVWGMEKKSVMSSVVTPNR